MHSIVNRAEQLAKTGLTYKEISTKLNVTVDQLIRMRKKLNGYIRGKRTVNID